MRALAPVSTLLVVLAACGDARLPTQPDALADLTEPDVPATADSVDANDPPDLGLCDDGVLKRRAWTTQDASVAVPFAGQAGDFALLTYAGPLVFSEAYTGCESWVVFFHVPGANDALFTSSADGLVRRSGDTTHYLFVSDAEAQDARVAMMDAAGAAIDDGLRVWVPDSAAREAVRARFHFGIDRASDVEGSLGEHFRAYMAAARAGTHVVDLGERGSAGLPVPSVVGIGPDRRFDAGGSLSPHVGAPAELGMAAFIGPYLRALAIDDALKASRDAVVVPLIAETTTARTLAATLPPGHLALGDTITLEVRVACHSLNPFGCSEWDRNAGIRLCRDGMDCNDSLEIARWITPYWRRGEQRYAFDVSDFASGLVRDTDVHLRVELGPEWERATEWEVHVDLVVGGPVAAPTRGFVPLFGNRTFDASYGATVAVEVPADAKDVALIALVSGHGQTAADNCAEWCDHRHVFAINGTDSPAIAHVGASIGAATGCAEASDSGLIPLQWGNWAQQRAYWCPGQAVSWVRLDVDALVAKGASNTVTLRGSLGADATPRGGDIALSSFLVWR